MTILILGLFLWTGAHVFKRIAPERRGALGERGKGFVALGVVLGVVLMVIGYRAAPFVPLWSPPPFLTHLNNLLMILAIYLFAASGAKTRITRTIRHPQLTAVKTWAVAHLLVNGDLASLVLFGGLLGWAVWEVILINRSTAWVRPDAAPAKKEVTAVVATVVVFIIVAFIHAWLGVWPFPS